MERVHIRLNRPQKIMPLQLNELEAAAKFTPDLLHVDRVPFVDAKIAESFRSTLWASKVRSSRKEYSRIGREIRGSVNHSGGQWWAISDLDRVFLVSSRSSRAGSASEFSRHAAASPWG